MDQPSQRRPRREQPTSESPASTTGGRFSAARLSSAFARLMGATLVGVEEAESAQGSEQLAEGAALADQPLRVTPELIVEGALFVGGPNGRPLRSSEIAAYIRDVDAAEVETLIGQLNERYEASGAACRIERSGPGFRLKLRSDLQYVRQRFRGQVRATKLSTAALEVLSLVAYRQPVSGATINRLRGSRSHAILSQLVRRKLLSIHKDEAAPTVLQYRTTERFNQLFGVSSPAELPRSEDLDDF